MSEDNIFSKTKKDLWSKANPEKALLLQRFFKTGKGEYAEGDIFLGISMPENRKVVSKYWKQLSFGDIQKLLNSSLHEERMFALLVLVKKYEKEEENRGKIFKLYIQNTKRINNWDLVDVTTPRVVGDYLLNRPRGILYRFVKSKNLWERRIAILATFTFIREGDFKDSIRIAELLLSDEHDLIHKAVGWMLREVGKRDHIVLGSFLKKNVKKMPRTMLRYAIEKFPEAKRLRYLNN